MVWCFGECACWSVESPALKQFSIVCRLLVSLVQWESELVSRRWSRALPAVDVTVLYRVFYAVCPIVERAERTKVWCTSASWHRHTFLKKIKWPYFLQNCCPTRSICSIRTSPPDKYTLCDSRKLTTSTSTERFSMEQRCELESKSCDSSHTEDVNLITLDLTFKRLATWVGLSHKWLMT